MKKEAFQHATPLAQEVESFRRSYPKVAAKVCKGGLRHGDSSKPLADS